MFVYAWDLFALNRERVALEAESAPTLYMLFANVLTTALERRSRYGVPRDYVKTAGEVGAVRGRIDVLQSVRGFAFARGRVNCVYDAYSDDTYRNRVIKESIKRLVDAGELQQTSAGLDIRTRLKRCLREMGLIGATTLHRESFRNYTFGRNDVDDALILSLCELLFLAEMPMEDDGAIRLLKADRDARLFRRVFEWFVWRFLERKLTMMGWKVEHSRQLKWPIRSHSETLTKYLPGMEIDIRLTSPQGQITIVDTKFADIVAPAEHGGPRFKSGHIYQIYTYCMTQREDTAAPSEAILLYPVVEQNISEFVQLPGLKIRFETIDLTAPWQEIEDNLSAIVLRDFPAAA